MYDYSAYKYENLLSVVIKQYAYVDVDHTIMDNSYTWVFNLDTKELINITDIYSKFEYTETELREKVQEQVEKQLQNYIDTESNDWDFDGALQNTMQKYDNDSKKYFVDNNGNLNVIVSTIVPFEREQYDFIYTIK